MRKLLALVASVLVGSAGLAGTATAGLSIGPPNAGSPETIAVACAPCVGGAGIPLNFTGSNDTTLYATAGDVLTFHYTGSDAALRNQFWIGGSLVFDNYRSPHSPSPVPGTNSDFVYVVPGVGQQALAFTFFSDVNGVNLPHTMPNTQIFMGMIDGTSARVGFSDDVPNNDHQDLTFIVSTPEPASLTLLGAGLLGLTLLRRRRMA